MRQRFFGLVVLSVLVIGAASSAAHDRFRVIGTIVKIDAPRNLLTMKTTNKTYPPEVEIELTTKTRIERNGRTASRTDLKAGVFVVVDALGDDVFDMAAVLVKIVPKPAK